MKTFKFLLLLCCFCLSCNPEKIDTKKVKRELNNMKIKRISEGEIISAADSTGGFISTALQKLISGKLDSALANGGIEAAIPFCILDRYKEKQAFEKTFAATISRTAPPSQLINSRNTPDEFEKQMLEAYSYSHSQKTPLYANTQLERDSILYIKPILLTEKQCLRCHGTPGKDLSAEEFKKLTALYPATKAKGLKLNDFMGVWSVKFDKKEFIRNVK